MEEISKINKAIKEKNLELILKSIEDHSLKYFFNLKLEQSNMLSLFHKLVLLDLTEMFLTIVDKFSEKFSNVKNIKVGSLKKDSLESNSNSNSNSCSNRNSINNIQKTIASLDDKSTNYEGEDNSTEISVVNLLSTKDKGGNTPMLFAAFRGNIKIMEKLIDLGVKYDCVNNAGLNIIHMAAQSDSANIIVYFKEKYNFELFQNDYSNNSSLHWACSSGSKSALDYLLLYINKENNNENIINSVNRQGQTSLHITILTTGSVSTIKKLIKKHIDLNIKDNNGLTVMDLVKDNDKYKNIEKIIIEYTDKNCLGLNYHINDKRNKYIKFIMLIILTIFITFSILYFFFPYLRNQGSLIPIIEYTFSLSTVIYLSFYIYIIFSDPGIMVKNNNNTWIDIIKSGKNINKMCPYCMVEQEKFSKHCFLCNKCIEIFDHHCHWINNCVGHLNKPIFLVFVVSLLVTLAVDSIICFYVLWVQSDGISNKYWMDNVYFRNIYCGIILLLSLFFIFPVSYLLFMQMKNKDFQKEIQTYHKEVRELTEDNNKEEKLLE